MGIDDIAIRFALKQEILNRYSSISQFATKSGLPRSTFSLIFRKKDPKPISFDHLVKITLALGYPEDHFFGLYIQDYFTKENFNRSRIEKVLQRYGELGLNHHLKHAIERLEDNAYYIPIIFVIAEELNTKEKSEAALLLYQWIVSVKTEVSQVLISTCHYRIFHLGISLDNDLNLELLYRFLPYRSRLPIHLSLDAAINAVNILYDQKRFEESWICAEELIKDCVHLFGTRDSPDFKAIAHYESKLDRHPVVYYGRAYLAKQCCLEGWEKYKKAQTYCENYGQLQWFDDGSKLAQLEIKKFVIFAQANVWNFELLQGNMTVLSSYVAFLEEHPEELITIVESANMFNFVIDHFLERFEHPLYDLLENPDGYYTEIARPNNLSFLLYHLAIYHFNAGQVSKSLNTAIQCWKVSQTVNNQQHFRLLASLTAFYNMYDDSTN